MREPRGGEGEEDKHPQYPDRAQELHGALRVRISFAQGLNERGRQEAAPREEAQEQDGDVEEDRPAVSADDGEEARERVPTRRFGVACAVEQDYRGVPRRGDQEEYRRPGQEAAFPGNFPPTASEQQIRDHGQQRDQDSDGSFGQGRQGHADIEAPVPAFYPARSLHREEETE